MFTLKRSTGRFCYSWAMDLSSHGVVALVRNDEEKFLLLEDARDPMKGLWAPPHGRCEPTDKSEEDSVIREVYEETGLRITPTRKGYTQSADTKIKTVSFWLVNTADSGVKLDAESLNSGWFTVEEILKLPLYPGTKKFFEMVQRNEILH